MTRTDTASGRRWRRTAAELGRRWDSLQDRVPAPVLRLLVMLPWIVRRAPVPFWVPLALMLVRRLRRRKRKSRV
ncbi:MAG TPA: hypothetical protein VHF06_03305 [Pseudonocardiaceae bacterium]|nr:hypothetical protein [Pseudonocardiaceae bacterium]